MVEKAMKILGHPLENINICYNKSHWKSAKIKAGGLFKLHGTMFDYKEKKDACYSLQTTLEQISRETPQTVIDIKKKKVLKKVLKKKDLVIMGYSGLDDLDIIPIISQISSQKRIIWILHKEGSKKIEVLEPIPTESNKKIKYSSDLEYVYDLFCRFVENGKRSVNNLWVLLVDTGYFIDLLSKHFFSNTIKQPKYKESEIIRPKLKDIPEIEKKTLTVKILAFLGKTEDINPILQDIIQNYDETIIPKIAPNYCILLSNQEGVFSELRFLKKSLEIAEKHQMELEKAFILDMMGRAYEELQNFSKAKEYYRKALKLYQKKKYKQGIARQYLNLGDIYTLIGSELRAILYYKRAIRLDKKIGSISHLPSVYNSLGVLFTTLFPSVVGLSNGLLGYLIALLIRSFGFRYYKRAIKIDKILGNWEGLSFEYLNRGILYTSLSFIKKAKIQFERSIELHKRFSTTASTIHNLRDIGYSLIQMGIDPSIYLARALKLLPKLPSDKREKERNIINRLIMQARGTRVFFRNEDLPF